MNFEKLFGFPKATIVIPFNLLQVLSIRASYCTCCANYTFQVLSSYFCFIHFGDGSYCLSFDKLRDTAPLTQSIIFA